MYNKLFTKILDSSIWLEPDATRIVWLTCIAVMDEEGFVQFASVENLARRANVSLKSAQKAVEQLEGPDPESSDPDNGGRRLERVQGGWMVLNATKYRELVTREVSKAQTRERVKRFRERKKQEVTSSNGVIRITNAPVTTSEACTEAHSEEKTEREKKPKRVSLSPQAPDAFTNDDTTQRAGRFLERYQELYPLHRKGARYALKPARDYAAAVTLCHTWADEARLEKLAIIFLTTDHKFAEEGSRTVPQFLALASWCDGKLAEWEADRRHA